MKEAANRGGLMRQWSGYRGRLDSVARPTPLASRSAQGQANPVSRRRSWRRRPIGLPLWHIPRTRRHGTLTEPRYVPILGCQLRQVPICSKLHTSIAPSNPYTRNYFEDRSKHSKERIFFAYLFMSRL